MYLQCYCKGSGYISREKRGLNETVITITVYIQWLYKPTKTHYIHDMQYHYSVRTFQKLYKSQTINFHEYVSQTMVSLFTGALGAEVASAVATAFLGSLSAHSRIQGCLRTSGSGSRLCGLC